MELDLDPRVAALVHGSPDWHEIVFRREVTSTQDVALGLLRDGAATGLVVVADAQNAGRGRSGRTWRDAVVGPDGPANLAVTASAAPPPRMAELASLATGLAVADTYRSAGAEPVLKWPNDVLLDERKAAGILVERHVLDGDRTVLLIGCGLNLDWRGVERSGEATGWISLAEGVGGDVDRGQVLVDLLERLGARLELLRADPSALVAAYRPMCATVGRRVRVEQPGGTQLVGEAVGIDESGRLLVDAHGHRQAVDVGDVRHVRPA